MEHIIEAAGLSVIGKVRNNNEDNLYFNGKNMDEINNGTEGTYTVKFNNKENKVFAVFDGMGGEANGERASYIASTILREYVKENENKEIDWNSFIQIANERICDEMHGKERMGTTMAGIQFCENSMSISNVGDSRIYVLSKDRLEQVSVDHNEAQLLERLNITNVRKARLTQYLGIKKEEMIIQPYIKEIEYMDIDKVLICSDGITDMLSDDEIKNILIKNDTAEDCVAELEKSAMDNGGIDNTTLIVCKILNGNDLKKQNGNTIINKIRNVFHEKIKK